MGTCRESTSKQEDQSQKSDLRLVQEVAMKSRQRKPEALCCMTNDTTWIAFCANTPFKGLYSLPMDFLPLVPESDGQYILSKRLPLLLF